MKIFDYNYRARRLKDSKIIKGKTEAPSKAMVKKFLQDQGLKPIEIYQKNSLIQSLSRITFGKTIKDKELLFYLRQLSSLLHAGVSLNEASEMLATQQSNIQVRRILYGLYFEVNSGTSLGEAMKEYPNDFPKLLISMIQVGETTGNLKEAISEVVEYYSTQFDIKQSIQSTMMMPIIYLVVALGVAIFIFVAVMPQFESLVAGIEGVELPGVTLLFMNIGNFVRDKGIYLALIFLLFALAFIVLQKRSKKFQRFLSYIAIKAPILGTVVKMSNLTRISATLSQLLNNHVPLQECLKSTHETLTNQIYKDLIIQAQRKVNAGGYMSEAFEHHYGVEVIFTRMISVGERTGDLGKMLQNLTEFYDKDSAIKIERVRKALEPIMLIFIFSLVVIMLLAIMLPTLSVTAQL
ncbi:MAG: type II secretion system F family protein [Candidatus Izimaplasma sp.]|nr:type II secretion system F family protein [Candidatus Izimaplasma bacterium]